MNENISQEWNGKSRKNQVEMLEIKITMLMLQYEEQIDDGLKMTEQV